MKIDRSNYEIWFTDWLDGNLNDQQTVQVRLFLSENPDLQEELKEMDSAPLIPPAAGFMGKSGLIRTPADISCIQFDYLCVASAENDLSAEGRLAELYLKLKLLPPDIRYANKKKLLKKTAFRKSLALSAALLSAAATVAILITLSIFISGNDQKSTENITQLITNKVGPEQSAMPQQKEMSAPEPAHSRKAEIIKKQAIFAEVTAPEAIKQEAEGTDINESLLEQRITELLPEAKVPSGSDIITVYSTRIDYLTLIPLAADKMIQPDERWAAGKFFAKLFRDKILKEETSDDSPIKGYEIAEAGVTGLNKLMGWEMAFERNNDENGELKSIYFSSKIIKIQAPVNKTENSD
jgi:hypothetical protein